MVLLLSLLHVLASSQQPLPVWTLPKVNCFTLSEQLNVPMLQVQLFNTLQNISPWEWCNYYSEMGCWVFSDIRPIAFIKLVIWPRYSRFAAPPVVYRTRWGGVRTWRGGKPGQTEPRAARALTATTTAAPVPPRGPCHWPKPPKHTPEGVGARSAAVAQCRAGGASAAARGRGVPAAASCPNSSHADR